MTLVYEYGKDDHIKALTLLNAKQKRDALLMSIFAKAAVGCAVYLSTAILRGTLMVNDSLSYLTGVVAFLTLVFLDNPRMLASLTFDSDLETGRLHRGLIGRRELTVEEDLLTLRSADTARSLRYRQVSGMTAFPEGLLIYLQDGATEFVPVRALKAVDGPVSITETIRQRVVDDKRGTGATTVLPLTGPTEGRGATYRFDQGRYLRVNALHERHTRAPRLKGIKPLVWVFLLAWIALGAAKGLIDLLSGSPPPFAYAGALYVLGLLAVALGGIILFRPTGLINWVMKKKLALHQAPEHFFDEHRLWWDSQGLTHINGDTRLQLAWPYFSHALTDGEHLLLYQHVRLVLFVPLAALDPAVAEDILAVVKANLRLMTWPVQAG